jgi:deoxyribose-phosphate aldolase
MWKRSTGWHSKDHNFVSYDELKNHQSLIIEENIRGHNVRLTSAEIAQLIDLSAVRAQDDDNYIRSLVECAKKYRCISIFPLPSRIPFVKEMLGTFPEIIIGGAVGFPSGGNTTSTKVHEAVEQVQMGVGELDVVINIGKLISGRYTEVTQDIRAVVDVAGNIPVKVILECHYLNETQIRKGCDACIEARAAWVKTGTGWAPTGATYENVTLIKSHVGNAIGVKAAGGIRDLKTVLEMYRLGVRRFGVGLQSGVKILEQAFALPDGRIELSHD